MVDNHWYIISSQQQHKHNLQHKIKLSFADKFPFLQDVKKIMTIVQGYIDRVAGVKTNY